MPASESWHVIIAPSLPAASFVPLTETLRASGAGIRALSIAMLRAGL